MNLTPCEQHRFAVALRAMLRQGATLAGATLLASLESELSDSASLRYLRPARLRLAAVRRLANPFISAKKEKNGTPKRVFRIFGGEERI